MLRYLRSGKLNKNKNTEIGDKISVFETVSSFV